MNSDRQAVRYVLLQLCAGVQDDREVSQEMDRLHYNRFHQDRPSETDRPCLFSH